MSASAADRREPVAVTSPAQPSQPPPTVVDLTRFERLAQDLVVTGGRGTRPR